MPALLGTGVGVLLIYLYLSVKSTRNQIVACFVLVSIAEFFFSSMIPAFVTGSTASFLSISTYFSTLGQIPQVIRERDNRYISLPIVIISLVNASLWVVYAGIKRDIPFFMTQFCAIFFMSINMIFYLWGADFIATESIQSLITIFMLAFPETSEVDLSKELGIDGADEEVKYDEEIAGDLLRGGDSIAAQKQAAIEAYNANNRSTAAATSETTRLTGGSAAGLRNPYLV